MNKKLYKKDLLTFSPSHLLTMTRYFGINPLLATSKVIDQLAEHIILTQRRKAEMPYADCTNDRDIITLEEWTDEESPDLTIRFIDWQDPTKKPYIFCILRDSLEQWISQKENNFARWIDKPNEVMDSMGHGGFPSKNQIYLKLPDGTFVENSPLNLGENLVGVPLETNVRIGNLRASLGVSELHGQEPGYTVYTLIPSNEYNLSTVINLLVRKRTSKETALKTNPPALSVTAQEEFITAIKVGDAETVKRLLENPVVDPTANHNWPLRASSAYGQADVVKLFLADGRADPTANDNQAIRLSSQNGHADVVQLLLADGRADPTVHDNKLIQLSSQNGHADVVKLLLADGRVDPTTGKNYAIQLSSQQGHADVVKLLLADGRADPTADSNFAIRLSSMKGHADVVQLLLADGRADPAAYDNKPLLFSSKNGHTDVVKLLLADGRADPTAMDNKAIKLATRGEHTEIVELLSQDPRVVIPIP
uniref:Ankyrin repeat protein n=1 Tax=Marseillevirus LCMAC202 TaxID=2506606 RepID=A0A481YZ18_9VIRU|nr:MAG: ankyrin repeat protein [Marseillevirus LCMAC202]